MLRLKWFNSEGDHPASLWGSWQMNKALLIYKQASILEDVDPSSREGDGSLIAQLIR